MDSDDIISKLLAEAMDSEIGEEKTKSYSETAKYDSSAFVLNFMPSAFWLSVRMSVRTSRSRDRVISRTD